MTSELCSQTLRFIEAQGLHLDDAQQRTLARLTDWEVTLLSLHDPPTEETSGSGLRLVSLGLEREIPSRFLHWLRANPQDLVISSGVSHIEPAFPYLPEATRHLVQIGP